MSWCQLCRSEHHFDTKCKTFETEQFTSTISNSVMPIYKCMVAPENHSDVKKRNIARIRRSIQRAIDFSGIKSQQGSDLIKIREIIVRIKNHAASLGWLKSDEVKE